MYARNYYSEGERVNLPGNYDGTAFMDREMPPIHAEIPETTATADDQPTSATLHTDEGITPVSMLKKIPILSGVFGKGGLIGKDGFNFPKLGAEEILIIATAAFLFFSKNGDRECALILLLLLFIN